MDIHSEVSVREQLGSYETPPLMDGGQGRSAGEVMDAAMTLLCVGVSLVLFVVGTLLVCYGYKVLGAVFIMGIIGGLIALFGAVLRPATDDDQHIDVEA